MKINSKSRGSQAGMTLIETMIAALILTVGVAAVAAVYTQGVLYMGFSQDDFVAKEKAREAVESVFTARDTQILTWAQICNVSGAGVANCAGGVFLDGPQPMLDPGPDGIVNTADDGPGFEFIWLPGPDNLLGDADDIRIPLVKYQREIRIRDIAPNLRSLTVIITYTSGRLQRQYTLNTLISQFS
jgi:hypothetical protein